MSNYKDGMNNETLINKLFVIDYLYKMAMRILKEDPTVAAYCDTFMYKEYPSLYDDSISFNAYISKLKADLNDRDYATGFRVIDKVLLPIIRYIKGLVELYEKTDLAMHKISDAHDTKDYDKLMADFDAIMKSIDLDKLEEAHNDTDYKSDTSELRITSMKNMTKLYYDPNISGSSFARYYSAYRLTANTKMQELSNNAEINRLYSEFFIAEKAFIFANMEDVISSFFNDRSVIGYCKAMDLEMPNSKYYSGTGKEAFDATDKFIRQFRAAISKFKSKAVKFIENGDFYKNEFNFFETISSLIVTLRQNDVAVDLLKPKTLLSKGKSILQNNNRVLEMLDNLCEDIKARDINDQNDMLLHRFADLKQKGEEFIENTPILNYKVLLEQFKQAKENDDEALSNPNGSAEEIEVQDKQTGVAVEGVPLPTITDIANQKYEEFEQLRDTVIALKDFDDETLVEFKLIVDHYNNELFKLISGKAIDSESLAEQVISLIDDFSNGEYAKYLNKFMYDINYHAQYELNELLSQSDAASLQQRDIMTNLSDKASKFGERYKLLIQESEDGSLDANKILSTYEKLADIKKEIAKLYNIYPSDVADRFSIKEQ